MRGERAVRVVLWPAAHSTVAQSTYTLYICTLLYTGTRSYGCASRGEALIDSRSVMVIVVILKCCFRYHIVKMFKNVSLFHIL